jgi:hypothetical protein
MKCLQRPHKKLVATNVPPVALQEVPPNAILCLLLLFEQSIVTQPRKILMSFSSVGFQSVSGEISNLMLAGATPAPSG